MQFSNQLSPQKIVGWWLKTRHFIGVAFKATFPAKLRQRRTFWTWFFCNTNNQVWRFCFVIVNNPLARTAMECSKEVYLNVLLPVSCFLLFLEVFDSFAVHSFGRMSRDYSGQESRTRWSFLRHRCNALEPDAAGISRTYPCAYRTRNLCQ